MTSFSIVGLFFVCIPCSIICLLALIKARSMVQVVWSAFLFAVALWGFGMYLIGAAQDPVSSLFRWRIAEVGVIFIPVFLTHFGISLLKLQRRWLLIVFYGITFIFLYLNLFTNHFINKLYFAFDEFYYISATPAYSLFICIFVVAVIYILFELIRAYKKATGIIKFQIKYLILGFFVGFSGGVTSYLPVYNIPVYPVWNATIIIFVIMVTYAIIRYRLMDIRIVVRKIFIYFGLSIFVYALYSIIIIVYTNLFGSVYESKSIFAGIIVAPLFVFCFYAFDKFFIKFANTYVFSGLYNYQKSIDKLSQELNYYTDLDKIIDTIVDTIKLIMHLDRAGVLLVNQSKKPIHYQIAKVVGFDEQNGISLVQDNFLTRYLQKNKNPLVRDELILLARDAKDAKEKVGFDKLYNHMKHIEASLCLPLISSNRLIGIVVLGSKTSGDSYTKEDLDLLTTLSFQAGIAVDNARLYEKVHSFNKDLKEKVNEQTKEIRKKNAYLEDLLKMKAEFLNIASHQLKTPISITRGYLSMLIDGTIKGTEKREDALEKAMFGINRLNETVKDFLDASDLEGKEIELEMEKTDLVELIQNVVSNKEVLVKEKKLKLEFTKPKEKLPSFNLDSSRLTEAISNLVDNAIFYTEKGEVTVVLSIINNNIEIRVNDTGMGISEEEQKQLFTKFKRSKKAILAKPDGSGLGLYIAKKIIELHCGEIKLESEVGKGTSFIITLPNNLKNKVCKINQDI